jgi:hypothetical protein
MRTFDFESSDTETERYEKVSAYLQRPDSIAFGLKPNQLVIIQARTILGSSVAAIAGFLGSVLERLQSLILPAKNVPKTDCVGSASNLETLIRTIPPYWEAIRSQILKAIGDPDTERGT